MARSRAVVRAPDAGAFVILTNGGGRGPLQWISANYSSGLLNSYAEHWVYQSRGGRTFGSGYPEMRRRLVRMLERRDAVDLFIYAHSNSSVQLMSDIPEPLRSKKRFVRHRLLLVAAAGQDHRVAALFEPPEEGGARGALAAAGTTRHEHGARLA